MSVRDVLTNLLFRDTTARQTVESIDMKSDTTTVLTLNLPLTHLPVHDLQLHVMDSASYQEDAEDASEISPLVWGDTVSKLPEHFSKLLSGSSDGATPSARVHCGHQRWNENMIQMTLKQPAHGCQMGQAFQNLRVSWYFHTSF